MSQEGQEGAKSWRGKLLSRREKQTKDETPSKNTSVDKNGETPVTSYWAQAERVFYSEFPDNLEVLQAIRKKASEVGSATDSTDVNDSEMFFNQILSVVANKKKEMEAKRWSLPFSFIFGDKEYKVRDVLDKTCQKANAFKGIGDGLASIDSLHAGTPWAAITLVLNEIIVIFQEDSDAATLLSKLPDIICQFTEVERIFFENRHPTMKTEDVNGFEKALIAVYTGILKCCVGLLRRFAKRTILRDLGSLVSPGKWKDLKVEIDSNGDTCLKYAKIKDFEVSKGIQKVLNEQHVYVKEMLEWKKDEEEEKIEKWMSTARPRTDHKRILEEFRLGIEYASSGQWLRTEPNFKSWLTANASGVHLFWLDGAVGTGKFCLTSRVIEWHFEKALRDNNEQVAYFYCSKKKGEKSEKATASTAVLKSFLRQLSWSAKTGGVEPLILDRYKQKKGDSDEIDIVDMEKFLKTCIKRNQRTTLIIDAQDECEDPSQLIADLHRVANGGIKDTTNRVNIFVSSRNRFFGPHVFTTTSSCTVTAERVSADMKDFVQKDLERPDHQILYGERPEIEQRVVKVVSLKAKAIFKWAQLQLVLIRKYKKDEDILARLDFLDRDSTLPELDSVYEEILSTHSWGASQKSDLLRTLQLVVGALQPLTANALAQAVSLDDHGRVKKGISVRYILDITNCLLIMDEHGVVEFAHLSVREYLQKVSTSVSSELSNAKASVFITRLCLSYLLALHQTLYTVFPKDYEWSLKEFRITSFSEYVLLYWAMHTQSLAKTRMEDEIMNGLLKRLFVDSNVSGALISWQLALERIRDDHTDFIQSWGLEDSFRTEWELSMERCWSADHADYVWDLKMAWLNRDPIWEWAAQRKHRATPLTSYLDTEMRHKMDHTSTKDPAPRHPFLIACAWGFHEIVEAMLKDKDHATQYIDVRNQLGATGLLIAAAFGFHTVITLLLDNGAERDAKDLYGRNAMWWAAMGDHSTCIFELADRGLRWNFGDRKDEKELSRKCFKVLRSTPRDFGEKQV